MVSEKVIDPMTSTKNLRIAFTLCTGNSDRVMSGLLLWLYPFRKKWSSNRDRVMSGLIDLKK